MTDVSCQINLTRETFVCMVFSSGLPLFFYLQEIIESKYKVPRTQIRAYFHYYPTYYHLHVHFNHIENDVGGISVGKAHLVSDVIENIENVDSDYYKKKTLSVLLRERDPLYNLLVK